MKLVWFLTTFAMSLAAAAAPEIPVVFEPHGSGFLARTAAGTLVVGPTGWASPNARARLLKAREATAEPGRMLPSRSNYFHSGRSHTVPHFNAVRYPGVYPGIDLIYYAAERGFEYDFVVAPGTSPSRIEFKIEGTAKVENGDLLIGGLRQRKPIAYQMVEGRRQAVAAEYSLAGNRLRFVLGQYDRSLPLVIDPVVQYSAYLGGSGQDSAVAIALDSQGNAYITGESTTGELATAGGYQTRRGGDQDVFVAKLSPSGSLEWLTYLGGSKTDTGLSIAVDSTGNAYVAGVTYSRDFPIRNAAQPEPAGGEFDVFVAKVAASGSQLAWSTYLGGSAVEWARGIAVDGQGGAWVTGWTTSADFPRQSAFQTGTAGGGEDVFLTRVAPNGTSFSYSTYFGGNGRDLSSGLAIDSAGNVYVAGLTTSTAFPVAAPLQASNAGDQDAFLFKLAPETNTLVYSTFLGGTGEDAATRVVVDGTGAAYLVGFTRSLNFPATRGAFQSAQAGNGDAFAAKISASGRTLEYATLIGGANTDWAEAAAVDDAGTLYVTGWTNSSNFPVRAPMQSGYMGGDSPARGFDGFVLRLAPDGGSLVYSTYFGGRGEDMPFGIALDKSNNVFIVGSTSSTDLPAARGAFTPAAFGAAADVFVARLSADSSVSLLAARPGTLVFNVRSTDTDVPPQQISISSTGLPLTFSAASNAPWLRVTPASGSTSANLSVTVAPAGLDSGSYNGEITVVGGQNSLILPVSMIVRAVPAIVSTSPEVVPRGSSDVTLSVAGAGFTAASVLEVNGARVQTTVTDSRTLRAVIPAARVVSNELTIVVVNGDVKSAPFVVRVSTGFVVSSANVLHGATRRTGAVAAGQIVSISGTGDPGARVFFDNVPVPAIRASAASIELVVPSEIAGRESVTITVDAAGQRSSVVIPVAGTSPGIFTSDGSGAGQAAALNQDTSLNSADNPAVRGSILVLYATGEGVPARPTYVLIGGAPAEILYAGPVAPGLLQLNVRVPADAQPGPRVPVLLIAETAGSPADTATVAIQ